MEQVGQAQLGVLVPLQNRASNGHTSTQMPQYMHSV